MLYIYIYRYVLWYVSTFGVLIEQLSGVKFSVSSFWEGDAHSNRGTPLPGLGSFRAGMEPVCDPEAEEELLSHGRDFSHSQDVLSVRRRGTRDRFHQLLKRSPQRRSSG